MPRPQKRENNTASSSDILARMLQLEKASQQQQRSPSSSPEQRATVPASRPEASPSLTAKPVSRQLRALSPLRSLQRLNKSPEPASRSITNKTELPTVADLRKGISTSSGKTSADICRSPSWSEYRGNKQKREAKKMETKKMEKEQKELEKKRKKEEEKSKATQVKATKKLSRRPPAAMDTQRMPAALRNPSPDPRSQSQTSSISDNSGRSSRERRRSSITSLVSFFGRSSSKSTPAHSPTREKHEPISSVPPQIGRLRAIDRSRSSSADTFGIAISDDEEYVKKLVTYAYEVQASPDDVEVKEIEDGGISASQPRAGATSSASQRSTDSPNRDAPAPINFSRRPLATRRGSTEEDYLNKQKPVTTKHPYKTPDSPSQEPVNKRHSKERVESNHSRSHEVPSRLNDTPSADAVLKSPATSYDGGSYVHKQRMYQQQRSINGYQDEMAVAAANQPKVASQQTGLGRPSMPPTPTPTDSAESLPEDRKSDNERVTEPEQPAQRSQDNESSPSRRRQNNRKHRQDPAEATPSKLERVNIPSDLPKAQKSLANKSPDEQESPSKFQDALEEQPRIDNPAFGSPSGSPPVPSRSKNRLSSFTEQFPKTTGDTRSDGGLNVSEESRYTTPTEPSTRIISAPQPLYSRSASGPIMSTFFPNQPPAQASRISLSLAGVDVAARSIAFHQKQDVSAVRILESPNGSSPIETRNTMNPREPLTPNQTAEGSSGEQARDHSSPIKSEATIKAVINEGLAEKPPPLRSHSDPEHRNSEAEPPLPTLDFLPELKHQPLVKPKRSSVGRVSFASTPTSIPPIPAATPSSSSSPPAKPTVPSEGPPSVLRSSLSGQAQQPTSSLPKPTTNGVTIPAHAKRSTIIGPTTLPLTAKGTESLEGLDRKPIGKMFVICCKCKHWHDLPSRLYEAMALPRTIKTNDIGTSLGVKKGITDTKENGKDTKRSSVEKTSGLGDMWRGKNKEKGKDEKETGMGKAVEGKLVTVVKCPWCEHGMSTTCCQGWTTIVYLHQKHH